MNSKLKGLSGLLFMMKCLGVILSLCVVLLPAGVFSQEGNENTYDITTEQVVVRGESLAPLINPGQTVNLLYGYYKCNSVKREDVVAYNYAGNDVPIIKIVKAVPGDKWRLKKNKRSGKYRIIVNNRTLRNSQGKIYQIPESCSRMLQLYVKNYPEIREDSYLILGNRISGSTDSSKFGLIGKNDILAKVEIVDEVE